MTDDSGGRTEIVRDARDLDPATAEHRRRVEQAVLPRLSRRRGKKDGRWHTIRVEVRDGRYTSARGGDTSRASTASSRRSSIVMPRDPSSLIDPPCLPWSEPSACRCSAASAVCSSPRSCCCCLPHPHAARALAGELRRRRAARRRAARAAARSARRCAPAPRVFGTLLAGILLFFVAREAGALAPLPHRRVRGARRHRRRWCSSATRSTTSSTAR